MNLIFKYHLVDFQFRRPKLRFCICQFLKKKIELCCIQNISFLRVRFGPRMEAKISSTMLAPTCPSVIPSFHIKMTLRLPFEDSLVSCLFLCLRLKVIFLIAYINFKHFHILCRLAFILIPFCSHFLKGRQRRSERNVVYRLTVALTSDQSSKTQATRCVTAVIFSVYQTQRLH